MNIWAPQPDGPNRPVMVFVHGGGLVAGSGRAPLYDGTWPRGDSWRTPPMPNRPGPHPPGPDHLH
ncbi:carboxylesterase family protein [Streptomyces sp. OE57]|uniref:carboxylesterase family protein n=1 Tax=Streptomyces lacaronensis TaxID=3379885 RepID=UPI0039B78962